MLAVLVSLSSALWCSQSCIRIASGRTAGTVFKRWRGSNVWGEGTCLSYSESVKRKLWPTVWFCVCWPSCLKSL